MSVQSLRPVQVSVNEHAIGLAKDILGRAERGEINFLLVLAMTPDGCVIDGWSQTDSIRPYGVAGGLAAISQKFIRENIE